MAKEEKKDRAAARTSVRSGGGARAQAALRADDKSYAVLAALAAVLAALHLADRAPAAGAYSVTPRSAPAFRDSVGVVTHSSTTTPPTATGRRSSPRCESWA